MKDLNQEFLKLHVIYSAVEICDKVSATNSPQDTCSRSWTDPAQKVRTGQTLAAHAWTCSKRKCNCWSVSAEGWGFSRYAVPLLWTAWKPFLGLAGGLRQMAGA